MVQGYPKEDSSYSSFGCSLPGGRNAGNFFPASGRNSGSGHPAFFEYRTSNPGGHPHDQRCSYQSEKFKLRRLEKSGRETGGLMLNITVFSLSAISTICAVNMIRFCPSSISSWIVNRKTGMFLSWCPKIYVWSAYSVMINCLIACLRNVSDPDTSLCM